MSEILTRWNTSGLPPADLYNHAVAVAEALRARCEQAERERDEWRNARHAFEAELFAVLSAALGHPDDATVADMAKMLSERIAALEAHVRRYRLLASLPLGEAGALWAASLALVPDTTGEK